jgi:hypothetical protein
MSAIRAHHGFESAASAYAPPAMPVIPAKAGIRLDVD